MMAEPGSLREHENERDGGSTSDTQQSQDMGAGIGHREAEAEAAEEEVVITAEGGETEEVVELSADGEAVHGAVRSAAEARESVPLGTALDLALVASLSCDALDVPFAVLKQILGRAGAVVSAGGGRRGERAVAGSQPAGVFPLLASPPCSLSFCTFALQCAEQALFLSWLACGERGERHAVCWV